jgi:hypothetical protein
MGSKLVEGTVSEAAAAGVLVDDMPPAPRRRAKEAPLGRCCEREWWCWCGGVV